MLVFHGMERRSDAQMQFATRLTDWGYQAIAVDLFGGSAGDASRVGAIGFCFADSACSTWPERDIDWRAWPVFTAC